jgi:uncharacterized protein (TIGR02266 family)
MTQDRRQQPRYAAKFDVRFSSARDAARALKTFSVNFSAGGLCVRSTSQWAPGEPVAIALTIEHEHFELEGVVAWARGDAVGLRFVDLAPEDRERLEGVARILATRQPALT